jgi:hypothetical protein
MLKLIEELPVERAQITMAPNVPPAITRQHSVRLVVDMNTTLETRPISPVHKYPFWTFNGSVPGPFIRARVGDVMEVSSYPLSMLVAIYHYCYDAQYREQQ